MRLSTPTGAKVFTHDAADLIKAYSNSKQSAGKSVIEMSYGRPMIDAIEDFLKSKEESKRIITQATVQGMIILNVTHPHLELNLDMLVVAEDPREERITRLRSMLTDALNQDDPRTRLALTKAITGYAQRRDFIAKYIPEILERI